MHNFGSKLVQKWLKWVFFFWGGGGYFTHVILSRYCLHYTILQSFKKIFRSDSETIVRLTLLIYPRSLFFRKFNLSQFCELIASRHATKFRKNPSSRIWDIKLQNAGPQSGQSIQLSQTAFLGSSDLYHFCLPITSHHSTKFQKNA